MYGLDNGRGFGRQVTERLVALALAGAVTLSFAPTGVKWVLDVPAGIAVAEPTPVQVGVRSR